MNLTKLPVLLRWIIVSSLLIMLSTCVTWEESPDTADVVVNASSIDDNGQVTTGTTVNDDEVLFDTFLMACSQGDIDAVTRIIVDEQHTEFVTSSSRSGESCLHVAGILGQAMITKFILKHGGNPNQRSLYKEGLRMTPLSWNVYGNHVENVRLLLQAGADVNLDFDSVVVARQKQKPASKHPSEVEYEKVTVLDLLNTLFNTDEGEDEDTSTAKTNQQKLYQQHQREIRDLLIQYGAQCYKDLQPQLTDTEL
jgi:ankyrin repeat protein